MSSALITRRQRARKSIIILFLMVLATAAAAVGTAPLVFLIWMLRTVPHWLGF